MILTPARSGLARSGATRSGYPVAQGAILPTYALSGIARSGATRSNYTSALVFISIGGVHYGTSRAGQPGVLLDSLQINDQLNETPTTATMTTAGFIPVEGQEVIVTIGSRNNGKREFAGTILSTTEGYHQTPRNYQHSVNMIDYTWGLNRFKVRAKFTASTVSAIAASLLATYTGGNYTLVVDPDIGAAKIDEITFTEQDLTQSLSQLVKRVGGAWQCDYHRRVRLFFTDTEGTPPTLINAVHKSLLRFAKTRDLSQTISRQYVEGGGANAAGDVPVGETILPVTAPEWYEAGGGVVVSGPQRIRYAACVPGGTGGLVGPGAAPSGAPVLTLLNGSGVPTGAHSYAITYKTATGESLASPIAGITVGPLESPGTAPTVGPPPGMGSGPDPGAHDYAVSFVTATGETTPGPRVTMTTAAIPSPTTYPTTSWAQGPGPDAGQSHDYAVSFATVAAGGIPAGETTPGPIGGAITTYWLSNPMTAPTVTPINDGNHWPGQSANFLMAYYYWYGPQQSGSSKGKTGISPWTGFTTTPGGAWTWQASGPIPVGSTPVSTVTALYSSDGGLTWSTLGGIAVNPGATWFLIQGLIGVGTGVAAPVAIALQTVYLSNIPVGPSGISWRKLWRRSGGAGLRYLATIQNNQDTSYTDTTPNANLQGPPPTQGTLFVLPTPLSNIPVSPSSLVTGRNVYRTKANGTALFGLVAIADNVTTSFLDTRSDASLGTNTPPVTNTAAANQVLVGLSIGAAAVTARNLYRTAANASILKLLATIADNATTAYLDALSDAALGTQSPPVSDTSGLSQPGSSQVPPGSTELIVANIGAFQDGGGWAIIGNGDQVIRYHGKTASKLTGIPASGNGAIVAAIAWNSTVTAAAALTGIPTSGNGAIVVAIIKGDEVNLFVQVDDLEARALIAAATGTDGIIEDYMQDRRLSHREAVARATAQLDTKNQVRVEVRYTTRDLNCRTGKLQSVNLGPPFSIIGDFLIQSVTERPHGTYAAPAYMPKFDAVASNARFTFDEFLRLIHDEVT